MSQNAWDSDPNRDWADDPERNNQAALINQLGGGGGSSSPLPTAPPPPAAIDRNDLTRTSANAPRVRQNAQGGWELTEHGNTRQLQGQEVQDATNYANTFWAANPTGFQANNPNSYNDAYQQFTGRAPDAAGLAAHRQNPGGFVGGINAISGSQEAQNYRPTITSMGLGRAGAGAAYRSGVNLAPVSAGASGSATGGATTPPPPGAHPNTPGMPNTPGAGTPPPPATTPPPTTPPPAGGAATPPPTGNVRTDQWSGQGTVQPGTFQNLEGYDPRNFADPNMQTQKYQVGRIMARFNPNDPQVLGTILADQQFRSLFPNARQVGPDKIDFGDGQGPIDVIRGHGAPGAGFAWQVGDDMASLPPGAGGGGGAPTLGQGGGATTMPITIPGAGGDDQSYIDQIMEEIDQLAQGSSGLDRAALLQQLQA